MHSSSFSRPMLWLACAFAVSILCFWYPMWLDSRIPPEHDARIGMVIFFSLPYLLAGACVALAAYTFLCIAARKHWGRAGLISLIVGTLLLLAAVLPAARIAPLFFKL